MSKKAKHTEPAANKAVAEDCGVTLEDAVIAELCERIGPEALAEILANPPAGMGVADPFSSCSPDACAACPSKSAGCAPHEAAEPRESQSDRSSPDPESGNGCTPFEPEALPVPTEEERAAILALDHRSVSRALRAEEPIATAVATEFIVHYSLKVAEVLRQGNEFAHVVKPTESTPAVECIAMAIVRESVAESLAMEASGWHNA